MAGRDFKQDTCFKTSPRQCLSHTRRGYWFSEELLAGWAEPPGPPSQAPWTVLVLGQGAGGDTGEPRMLTSVQERAAKQRRGRGGFPHQTPLPGPAGTLQKASTPPNALQKESTLPRALRRPCRRCLLSWAAPISPPMTMVQLPQGSASLQILKLTKQLRLHLLLKYIAFSF